MRGLRDNQNRQVPASCATFMNTPDLDPSNFHVIGPLKKSSSFLNAFRSGRNETADLQRTGRPSIPQDQAEILSDLLSINRQWTDRELSLEVGLRASNDVEHKEKKNLNRRKIAAH
ncbi:hypothetical protein TNCV_2869431 [Trichonephila clavipes]|nr:hypothetical protein TNCV_2869431 [Trichonephila clavipes]